MWQESYEVDATDVTAEQIWKVWADINNWNEWDAGIEYARTKDPFQKGCKFELKPKGGPKLTIEIIECNHGKDFTDLTRFPLAKMYGRHEVQSVGSSGIRLKTTMTVTGPLGFLWRKLVAQNLVNDLPKDTAKIIDVARKR